MIAAIVCLLSLSPEQTALDLLKEVRDHYRALTSFSMTIDHHNSSGLFPGDFEQKLRWRKGSKFDLIVSKPNPLSKDRRAPDYFANGTEVLARGEEQGKTISSVEPKPNYSPGWEVSGGPIISWLQETAVGKMFFDAPKGLSLEWSFGPAKEWRKLKTRELLGKMTQNGSSNTIHFYVDEKEKSLIGVEYDFGTQKGYVRYLDQVFNGKLPSDVGDWPKK